MADRYGNDGGARSRGGRAGRDPWWLHEQNPAQGFSAWRGDASDPDWHEGRYAGGRTGRPDYGNWNRGPDYDRDWDRDYGQDFGGAYGYGYRRSEFGGGTRQPDYDRDYGRPYWRDYARDYSARDWRGGSIPDYNRGPEDYNRNEPFSRDWDYAGYGARAYPGAAYRRGRFAGRGPKGYRRSDERIREDVSDLLTVDPTIDASDIEVRVANGVVTLTGVVEDRSAKRLAEDLAEDVMGVEDINNQLKVRHGFLAGITGEKANERELPREPAREAAATPGSTRRAR